MHKRQVPIRDVEIGQHVRIETVSRDTLMPVTYCGTVERKIIGSQFRSTRYVRLWIDDPRSGHVETIKRHTDEITVLSDDERGGVEMAWLMFVTVALLCALYLPYALMIAAKYSAINKSLGQ